MCYLCQLATESVVQIYSINRKICASQAIFFHPACLSDFISIIIDWTHMDTVWTIRECI